MSDFVQSSIATRPQNFAQVLGQDHVTVVLRHAVERNKVPGVALFMGQRGTGKTSVARVLAKAINCDLRVDGTAEPCGTCTSCFNIKDCRSGFVHEVDAATSRGIDFVKMLQDLIRQTPPVGKKRVIILDECHQLTNEAQSALLRTFEESAGDVLFILVTTEQHKVLDTIVSRSMPFDFRPLSMAIRKESVLRVFQRWGVQAEDEAVRMLVVNSDGSLRDLLQWADQVAATAEGMNCVITADLVAETCGLLSVDMYKDLAAAMCSRDFAFFQETIEILHTDGVDLGQLFATGLLVLFREFRLSMYSLPYESESGISPLTMKERMPFSDRELALALKQYEAVSSVWRARTPPKMLLEIFYARFVDEIGVLNAA